MKNTNHILTFENLSQFDTIVHGFSTRPFGSMRPIHSPEDSALPVFATALQIDPQKIVRMHQRHTNTVRWVSQKDAGSILEETDGLLTDEPELFLGVVAADCIPLLLYDSEKKYLGAIHAGWRGLYNQILNKTVLELIDKGSNPNDIIVGIGPSIRGCCYEIAPDHENLLLTNAPDWQPFISYRDGKIFLDPPAVAIHQLTMLGIPLANIEDANMCTLEHNDVYSYRREGKDFGEHIGIIGRKS